MSEKDKKLLQHIAELLAANRIVEHPCNVALVQFSTDISENRYTLLFSDWQKLYYHYAYPTNQFIHHVKEFQKEFKVLIGPKPSFSSLGESVGKKELQDLDRLDKLQVLNSVAAELREVVFHLPVTEEIYNEARKDGKRWGYRHLWATEGARYVELNTERRKIEAAKGHSGHWQYGLLLEKFFLNILDQMYYAIYFIRKVDEHRIDLVAAACRSDIVAQQFGKLLDSKIDDLKKYKVQKNPLNPTCFPVKKGSGIHKQRKVIRFLRKVCPAIRESLKDEWDKVFTYFEENKKDEQITDHFYRFIFDGRAGREPSLQEVLAWYSQYLKGGPKCS